MSKKTGGRAECPLCHKCNSQLILSMDDGGHPSKVRCPACDGEWTYYTLDELRERKREGHRRNSRKYREKNKDKIRESKREYHKKHYKPKEFEYVWARCPVCGEDFLQPHANQVYCSVHCRNRNPRRLEYMRNWNRKRRAAKKNECD